MARTRNKVADPVDRTKFDEKTLLIGLGAHKAGTTWLSYYFDSHPQVLMSPLKELHYFDRPADGSLNWFTRRHLATLKDLTSELEKSEAKLRNELFQRKYCLALDRARMMIGDEYYLKFFEERILNERVFCDMTPSYSTLNSAEIERMSKIHPDVRFLFIMRNPVDRHWSALRFQKKVVKNFNPLAYAAESLGDPKFMLRGDYKRTIENLEKAVPESRILYLFYETLFTDETIAHVCSFLGIDPFPARFDEYRNVSETVGLPEDLRRKLASHLKPVTDYVLARFGDRVPQEWRTS